MKNLQKQNVLGSVLKGKTKSEVLKLMDYSNYHSSFDVWKYELIHNWIFLREMILFFDDEEVYDVQITDYLLGNKIREYFY